MRLLAASSPSSQAEMGETCAGRVAAKSRSIASRTAGAIGASCAIQRIAQVSSSRAIFLVEIRGERRIGRLGKVAVDDDGARHAAEQRKLLPLRLLRLKGRGLFGEAGRHAARLGPAKHQPPGGKIHLLATKPRREPS